MENSRRDQILKLIVEDFIETAEPIGSQTLIERHGLNCSSATVRNEMMALEAEGLIEKPHHSAGRIPSTKGYRYYLSRLQNSVDRMDVDQEFKREFAVILNKKTQTVEDVMERSCEILSEMTNLATVVLGPEADMDHLASIQIVPLSGQALTAIIVTDRGYVENKTFVVDDKVTVSDLETAVQLLNKRLTGTAIGELEERLNALRPLVADMLGEKTNMIMEAFAEAFVNFAKKRLETFGTMKLLDLPEYTNDREKLVEVMKLLSTPSELGRAIGSLEDDVGVIGGDDKDLAIVTRDVSINGHSSGKIAVVGPKRMNYRKVLGTLEYITRELGKYFDDESDDSNKEEDDD